MKHIIFSILFFLVCQINAQNEKFGIIGGGNLSTILGNFKDFPTSEVSPRLSFHIGVFANFKLTDKFTFLPQISFSSIGYKSKSERDLPTINFENENPFQETSRYIFDYTTIYNYLNSPLEFRYEVNEKINLILGPQIGFLLQAKYKGELSIDGVKEKTGNSYKFNPKLDYGFILGISYNLSTTLFLDLKYYQGISNSNRKENIYVTSEIDTYNSVFELSLGYYLF